MAREKEKHYFLNLLLYLLWTTALILFLFLNIPLASAESEGNIYVSALDETGSTFTASKDGIYRFIINSGASEVCPPSAQPDHPEWWGWKTEILIYKNRPIEWGGGPNAPEHPNPRNWDFSVGDATLRSSSGEAEQIGRGMYID